LEPTAQAKEKKKEVIFIKNFIRRDGSKVDQKLVDTISQQFYLAAQTKYGDQYDVNDESVIKVLNAKAEELLRKNCDAEKCMEAISEKIKARFSVYGEIEDSKAQEGFFLLKMHNLIRDSSTGEIETKSIPVTFQEFQKDYYIGELVKSIENPKYKPDPSKAPKSPNLELKLGSLTFQPIETGKLPDINSLKLDSSSGDTERYKTALSRANAKRDERKWKEAAEIYLTVYDFIQKKEPEDRKKFKSISDLAVSYHSSSQADYHKSKMDAILEEVGSDETNIRTIESAISRLGEGAQEYESLQDPRYPANTYNKNLTKSYQERIDALQIRKIRLLEAKADKAYYNQEFAQAIEEYSSLINEVRSMNRSTPPWKQIEKDLFQKKDTSYKNGLKTVRSLIDQLVSSGEASYEEWAFDKANKREELTKCKESFDKAIDLLQKEIKYKPFITQDLIDRYNRKVSSLRSDPKFPIEYYPKFSQYANPMAPSPPPPKPSSPPPPPLKPENVTVTDSSNKYSIVVADSNQLKTENVTVTDSSTGLLWQRCTAGQKSADFYCSGNARLYKWQEAISYCKDLSLAGRRDWRLPSHAELQTLIKEDSRPAIDSNAFPNTLSNVYWSSTTHAQLTSSAWYVAFDLGSVYYAGKTYNYYVRCVTGP
jgi:hypothetical protein